MDDDALLAVLTDAAWPRFASALDGLDDWKQRRASDPGSTGWISSPTAAALRRAPRRPGSGRHVRGERVERPDSVPGASKKTCSSSSTRSTGRPTRRSAFPWFATSLCVLDGAGARVALVVNQATGVRYEAVRGRGARRDGRPIAPSGCRTLSKAIVGISGFPDLRPGWAQFRALGSAALDHCAVAEGVLDGYRVVGGSSLFGWDYLGGMLLCLEAGAAVGEYFGNDLIVLDDSRRWPVAAATPELLAELLAAKV